MAKKRANGEGYVRQRKDGIWEAGSARDEFGKRIVAYGATQKIAMKKRDQKLKEKEQGLVAEVAKLTLATYLRDWLETVIRRKGSPKTYDSYKDTIDHHILAHFGETLRLRALTPAHCDQLITAIQNKKLTRTVGYARDILRSALNTAVRRGYIARNPMATIVIPKTPRTKQHPFTEEQARIFLAALHGHPDEALFRLILTLGLRKGEALAIRDSDLLLDRQLIILSGNVQRVGGKVTRLDRTKGDEDAVSMPLPPSLITHLRAQLTRRDALRSARISKGQRWDEHGLVFPSSVGTPIDPANILTRFKAILKQVHLPAIRIHDLRHSCASFLIAQGEHPRVIMEILRHKQISITMELYGHVEAPLQRSALNDMERRFSAGGSSGGGSGSETPGADNSRHDETPQ